MFSSSRSVAGIAILFISFTSGLYDTHASNKPAFAGVNDSGTIVLFNAVENSNPLFSEIYPRDGKIEGKKVSKLSPTGINALGQVVGLCTLDGSDRNYPFFREPDGRFWIFKIPSSSGEGEFTDISDSGKAVGSYEKETKTGFLMSPDGQWLMDIRYPSGACPATRSYLHTQPNGINDKDEIIGNYECTERPDDAADPLFNGNGFYRDPDGTFYRLQYGNASRTVAGKISNDGIIFGYYVVGKDKWIPFAEDKNQILRPLVP